MSVVNEVSLVESQKPGELARVDSSAALIALASDPNFNPATLQALIDMRNADRMAHAEEQFNAAMSKVQAALSRIAADSNNPQTRSKYASYAAIDRAIRPDYTKHGFALSFDTGEAPATNWVRILCIVTHAAGFSRTYHIDMPADGKGAKGGDVMTLTHATGAATAYGRRYLVNMIFNLAIGEDTDGNTPQAAHEVAPPSGLENWKADLEVVADDGYAALEAAWKASPVAMRNYINAHDRGWLAGLKSKAKVVK